MEYLTVEYSELHKPLKFRFADNSSIETNHLQEFLNRQESLGWELMAIIPLTYISFKKNEDAGLHLHCCRLVFRGPVWPNAHNDDIGPRPGGSGPNRPLKPV